jgi:DNA-binding MarR family transcriptional regulator
MAKRVALTIFGLSVEAKQTDIAKHIGKSERTIKRITPSLIERGLLERENGKRNGRWVVKCDI